METFIDTLIKIKDSDRPMYYYLFLLYSTGCRGKALRDAKFEDLKEMPDGRKVIALHETKTNKTFVREIPGTLYIDQLAELRQRKALYRDDPDKYGDDFLVYIFTFRTRQAAHKRLAKLKKEYPVLKDWEFGNHDLRRLRARKIASEGGIEQAQKELGHSNRRVTMLYLDQNVSDLKYLQVIEKEVEDDVSSI